MCHFTYCELSIIFLSALGLLFEKKTAKEEQAGAELCQTQGGMGGGWVD